MVVVWELGSLVGKPLYFSILIDKYRLGFGSTVLMIRARVFIFRYSYIKDHPGSFRFHCILGVFVTSILLLIFSPNYLSLLLGWDGLGFRSYLLVIFYGSKESFKAGILTFVSNRTGDAMILTALGMLFWGVSANLIRWGRFREASVSLAWVITLASCTKSAQIPFRAWLPAAMAAPTPVSSLVHSSTLVTAGVYLLIRFESRIPTVGLTALICTGTLTITIARLRALKEIDMKKIIALSTLSQLGVIIVAVGRGAHLVGFFHLLAHAFFKALLFIRAGSIIHSFGGYQDIRIIAGTEVNVLSATTSTICRGRLCGMPFLSAFYSKEIVIELLACFNYPAWRYTIALIGAILTAAYSARMIILSCIRDAVQPRLHSRVENDLYTSVSISILLIPAIVGGWFLYGALFEGNSVLVTPLTIKITILILVTLGLVLTRLHTHIIEILPSRGPLITIFSNLWSWPQVSRFVPYIIIRHHGGIIYTLHDFSWLANRITRITYLPSWGSKTTRLMVARGSLWFPIRLLLMSSTLILALAFT